MASETVDKLELLRQQIAAALGRGEFPENDLREFRFLWKTTPDSEREGYSFTLKDLEEMVQRLRKETALASGAGKIQRIPVTHARPHDDSYDTYRNYAGGCW